MSTEQIRTRERIDEEVSASAGACTTLFDANTLCVKCNNIMSFYIVVLIGLQKEISI